MTDHFNVLKNSGLVNEEQRQALVKNASEDMAIQAVNGMLKNRQYDEATDRVLKGDISPVFDSTQRLKMLELIDQKKVVDIDRDLKEQAQQKAKDKQDREDNQRESFGKLVTAVNAAQTPEALTEIEQTADRMLASDRIDKDDNRFIKQMIRGDLVNDDGTVKFNFVDQITEGKKSAQDLRSDIKRSVSNRTLNPSSGIVLLNQLRTYEEERQKNPTFDTKLKDGENRVKSIFGAPGLMDFAVELEIRKRASDAVVRYHELIDPNGAKMDPLIAADTVIKEFGTVSEQAPVVPGFPAIDQTDSRSVLNLAPKLDALFRSGQISKPEYDKRRKAIMDRSKLLKQEEAERTRPKVNK